MDIDIDLILDNAIKNNQEKALHFLLSKFPDRVIQKLKSPKLLRDAVENSALNIISFLLDHGADINEKYKGNFCLTKAVDVKVLDFLLTRGADQNVMIGHWIHTRPIHTFVSREFRNRLQKRWRSLTSSDLLNSFLNSEVKDFIECLVRHGGQVDLRNDMGETPLHVAAKEANYVSIVQVLIDYGADVNKIDNVGKTPLWYAVYHGIVENVKCLINNGAKTNCVLKFTGKSELFEATNGNILKILLDIGVSVKPIDGDSPLNSLLAECHIGTENVKRLIDAGCNVNHENNNGSTVLIHAAKYFDIKLLKLLIQEGADVNASERKFPYKTAITALLKKLWNHRESSISCIHYLMDHNANVDNVHSCAIHCFITSGCLSLIPRFISNGLAPAYLLIEKSSYSWLTRKTNISPLMMALVLNQPDLARYFISINYLMNTDIDILYGSKGSQVLIEEASASNSNDFLKSLSRSPFSLETLCFVVISDTLGSTQDRRSNVQKLGLPQPMQDLFLFKNATDKNIPNMDTKKLLLFKYSLQQMNLYKIVSDNEDREDASFFYSD